MCVLLFTIFNFRFGEKLAKTKMIYLAIIIAYRIGIDKQPSFFTHKVERINNRVELSKSTLICSDPVVFPEAPFFTKINFNGHLVTKQSWRSNYLAILFNCRSVCLRIGGKSYD